MKNINKSCEIWFYIIPFVVSWMLIIQFTGVVSILSIDTIKKIPDAVMYTGIFYFLFSKYFWRFRIFRKWLVPYPNLQGTWTGVLKSTWINPKTNKSVDPIPVQFCIRQDFENIHISMHTKESSSFSQAARFILESDNTISLSYTYSNKPQATVRDRSEVHDGAAYLRIIESETLRLEGEYWTSRKTTGDINIKKTSDDLINCFTDTTK
jgi:hypothetical protein